MLKWFLSEKIQESLLTNKMKNSKSTANIYQLWFNNHWLKLNLVRRKYIFIFALYINWSFDFLTQTKKGMFEFSGKNKSIKTRLDLLKKLD